MEVQFINCTFLEINVYKKENGTETLVKTLAPMLSYSQSTNANDNWVFKDKNSGIQIEEATIYSEMVYFNVTEENIHSQNSSTRVSVTFSNKNTFPVEISWIDYEGNISTVSSIVQPGKSVVYKSFYTHPFIVFDTVSGQEVFLYIINQTPQQTCDILTRSINSNISSNLTLENNLNETVDTFWLDYEGKEVKYAKIEPGKSSVKNTFAGHPWIIRNSSNGDFIDFCIARSYDITFNIRQEEQYNDDPLLVQALEDLQNSVLAYYPLNSNGNDYSYSGHDGATNGAITYQQGQFGNAANFSAVGSYISLPTIDQYASPYIMSAWVNLSAPISESKYGIIAGQLSFNYSNNQILFNFPYEDSTGRIKIIAINSQRSITGTTWHNIIIAFDTSKKLHIYFDGQLDSITDLSGQLTSLDKPLLPSFNSIGGNSGSDPVNYINFNGLISDVSFYNISINQSMVSVLANITGTSSRQRSFQPQVIWFLAIPLCLAVVNIVAAEYYVNKAEKERRTIPGPDYNTNKRLPSYIKGQPSITLLDIWGEGRIVDGDMTTGFPNSYNLNKKDQLVSNGPDRNEKIPNLIPVNNYETGFDSNLIKDNSVIYMTLMGAPIHPNIAKSMARAINKTTGVIVIYGMYQNDSNLQNLKTELTKINFDQKTEYQLDTPFNEIRMSSGVTSVFAPSNVNDPEIKDEL